MDKSTSQSRTDNIILIDQNLIVSKKYRKIIKNLEKWERCACQISWLNLVIEYNIYQINSLSSWYGYSSPGIDKGDKKINQ